MKLTTIFLDVGGVILDESEHEVVFAQAASRVSPSQYRTWLRAPDLTPALTAWPYSI
jgi:hypothetical protein